MHKRITTDHVTFKNKMARAVWNVCHAILFRPFGTKLFHYWRILLLKTFGAKVDWKAEVYASTTIWAPWNLKMEAGSCLGPHVVCYNQATVTLEEDVTVSQYSYICTAGHDTTMTNQASKGLIIAPITFRKRSWIGVRAFIGMGVEIGEDAIVGATASVYKDVEPLTVVGGNPAHKIKDRKLTHQ